MSHDPNYLMEDVVEDSIANVNYPIYFQKIEYLTKKYYNKIKIKKGLEFGIQRHTIDKFKKLYNRYTFDFIILSIHQIEDKEFWTSYFKKVKLKPNIIKDTIKNCMK